MDPYLELLRFYESPLAAVTYVIAIISVPVFLAYYLISLQREKENYDRAVHERLDAPYYQYLQYCIEYPELDIGEFPLSHTPELDETQLQRQRAIFAHLMSVFETAFVLYAKSSSKARRTQWAGWDAYIRAYCTRDGFRRAWIDGRGLYSDHDARTETGSTLDKGFDRYMASILSQ